MRLWELPGAIRYLRDIEQALRLGDNVVIRFPNSAQTSLFDAIWSTLDGCGLRLTYLAGCARPEEALGERFLRGLTDGADMPSMLCNAENFSERLIFLDVPIRAWERWCKFLEDYARTCRATPIGRRSLFVATVAGTPPGPPPTAGTVRVFEWDDVVDEVDILAFANDYLRRKGKAQSLARLLASAVASLAAWDFDTARRLLDERDHTILRPTEMLRSWGRERGWNECTPISWDLGTASRAGTPHAARSALDDPPLEIHRRLWIAQASVLLPRIEARRTSIVKDNFHDLKRWLVRADQSERDPLDLEIGDLYRMFQDRGGRTSLRREIGRLRVARNALAHVDPLEPAVAIDLVGDGLLTLVEVPA